MKKIIDIFFTNTIKHPNKLFLADASRSITYIDAKKEIIYISRNLFIDDTTILPYVMIECTQDIDFVLKFLAIKYSHYIPVPLEKNISVERKKFVKCELLKSIKEQEICFDDIDEILFTTGTTGKSKGVIISHINNIAIAENIINALQIGNNQIELVLLPFSHSHALRTLYAHILNGSSVVIADGVMNVKSVFDLIEKYNVDAFDFSPTAAFALIKLSKGEIKNYQVQYIELGTQKLDDKLKNILIEYFPNSRIYNFYGSTESGRVASINFNLIKNKSNSIGRPSLNASFAIFDNNKSIINSDANNIGHLAIKGKMNMIGYLNEKELTNDTVYNEYVVTSDLGYIDDEGYIYILGRDDDIINYNGIKIAPDEIENIINEYSYVEDCAVIGKCFNDYEVPILYIKIKNDFDMSDFNKYLSIKIERNKMPKQVIIIDKIPYTYNGKKWRKKLKDEL